MTGTHLAGGAARSPVRHDAYVRRVVTELAVRDLAATDLMIDCDPIRRATMTIHETAPEPLGSIGADTEWIRLGWTEHRGWFHQLCYPDDSEPRPEVYFGRSLVPPPEQVAHWMVICLVVPAAAPSAEDVQETPDLDEVLRAYEVTAD